MLRGLSLYSKNGNNMRSFLRHLESFVETDRTKCQRQTGIADYFLNKQPKTERITVIFFCLTNTWPSPLGSVMNSKINIVKL